MSAREWIAALTANDVITMLSAAIRHSSGWTAWDGSFRWRLMPTEAGDAATAAGTENENGH